MAAALSASVAPAFCAPLPLHHPRPRALAPRAPRASPHPLRAALAAPSPEHGVPHIPPQPPAAASPALDSLLSPPFNALRNAQPFRVTLLSAAHSPQLRAVRVAVQHQLRAHRASLSPWRPLSPGACDAQVRVPPSLPVEWLRAQLFQLGRAHDVDVVLQTLRVANVPKRLALFDLDSTLIAQETIDELAAEMHVHAQCRAITQRAMNGEIAFRDALAQRVQLLRGLPTGALHAVKSRVRFTRGAPELVHALRRMGCRTAVVSGGFHFLADHVRDALGLDFAFANRLEVDEHSRLTGRTLGRIVDAQFKSDTLTRLAARFALSSEQTMAVGDGSNDLLMMHSAGLGVAFNAKPAVQTRAKCRVNQSSLTDVLYLLGLSQSRIRSLLADARAGGAAHQRLA